MFTSSNEHFSSSVLLYIQSYYKDWSFPMCLVLNQSIKSIVVNIKTFARWIIIKIVCDIWRNMQLFCPAPDNKNNTWQNDSYKNGWHATSSGSSPMEVSKRRLTFREFLHNLKRKRTNTYTYMDGCTIARVIIFNIFL